MVKRRKKTTKRRSPSIPGGKYVKMLTAAGIGIAAGAGMAQLAQTAGATFNIPQAQNLAPIARIAGAYFAGGQGIPGALAAFVSMRNGTIGGTTSQSGVGAFT